MTTLFKTYLTTLYRSIFSPPLYADVIHRWKGTGLLYLLLVSFVISIILCFRLSSTLLTVPEGEIDYLLNQMPVIEIVQGELTVDVERPYNIVLKDGAPLIRFLENVDLNTVQQENQDVSVIISSQEFIIIKEKGSHNTNDLRIHSFNDIDNLIINKEIAKNVWNKWKLFGPLLALPFVTGGLWIGYLIQAVIIASFSYVVTAFMEEEYIFTTRLRMSVVAFTPVLFVNQLSELILHHKMNFAMMATMACLYIFVMIKTSRECQ